jgi:hypothetical protein
VITLFVRLVAQAIFWCMRRSRLEVALGAVSAAALASLASMVVSRNGFEPSGSYITANGTTATQFQVNGSAGPEIQAGGSGGLVIARDAGAVPIVDFGDTSAQVSLEPGVSLAAMNGDGGVSLGGMTGNTTLPTGNLSWAGATGEAVTLTANGTSNVSTSAGTLTLDGPTVSIGPSASSFVVNVGTRPTGATVNIGNQTSTGGSTVNIGSQSPSSNDTVNIGPPLTNTTTPGDTVVINTGTSVGFPFGGLLIQSSELSLQQAASDFILLGQGQGSNVTVSSSSISFSLGGSFDGNTLTTPGGTVAGPGVGLELNSSSELVFANGGTPVLVVENQGFQPQFRSPIACGTGGTFVLPTQSFGIVVTTGTLTSNCVLNFSPNASDGYYLVDLSGATVGAAFGLEFENGTATYTATTANHTSGATLAHVWTHGANTLSVSY